LISVVATAAVALAALIAIPVVLDGPSDPPKNATPAVTASSRPFASSSVWNRPISAGAPLSRMSKTYVSQLRRQIAATGDWINTTQFSVPVYTVPAGQPRVPVKLDKSGGSADALAKDFNAGVPIPRNARAAAGTDRHMVVWQPSKNTMWEFWEADKRNGRWHAAWGGEMTNMSRNRGYFPSPADWGATATGLPLLGGLIRISELRAGRINHALALAIPHASSREFAFPAQRSDGNDNSASAIPEGTRFRLNPKLDLNTLHLSAAAKAIAVAAQRYGIVVRDQSGSVDFYAEDPGPTGVDPYVGSHGLFSGQYPNNLLHEFPWQDLEVVAAPTTKT
jgi:hypothetical protein